MTVCDTVLQKIAKRCMLKLSEQNQFTPACLSDFEELLQDVYVSRQPTSTDYEDRLKVVRFMNDISKELYGRSVYPTVEEYGSFLMGLFSADSDLDLSVKITEVEAKINRNVVVKALTKFAEKLSALQSKGHFYDLKRIFSARVPIINIIHRDSGIECDISIGNEDGVKKSKIIQIICGIDARFQQLSFLLKEWAKAHQINSARAKTMNSLSIILLAAFHLQTCEPPILPPFSAIFRDGSDPERVMEVAHEYKDYGKSNRESTANLFVSFLIKLASVKKYWSKGLCASTYHGTWTLKLWADEIGFLSVEDFSTRNENVARAVKPEQLNMIYDCISNSLNHIARFQKGQIQRIELQELLFGRDPKFCKRKVRTKVRPPRLNKKKVKRAEKRKAAAAMAAVSSNVIQCTPTAQSTHIHENLSFVPPLAPDPFQTHHAGSLIPRTCELNDACGSNQVTL